ncbi:MAG: DUF4856 domain-containing protein [Kordia sp.]|nr:MAG: DUF4856 domain-containing protein [Kordia sp.]
MKKVILSFLALSTIAITSCSDDDNVIIPVVSTHAKTVSDINLDGVIAPVSYTFDRSGNSSVSFGGQTTRIKMAKELSSALKVSTNTEVQLDNMYADGTGFDEAGLDTSGKKLRNKSGASLDFFDGEVEGVAIKTYFDNLIKGQVDNVFVNWTTTAASGIAGQITDGSSTRYVNAKGIENNQVFAKGLIGALQLDQALNGYMSKVVNDDNATVSDNHTTMEHHFDEAYGYLMNSEDDAFFSKYLTKVDSNPNFTGIESEIGQAFRIARQAIVDQKYAVRDQAIEVLRYQVSKAVAVRTIHYLQAGKAQIAPSTMGGAFHDLSEGMGFVYSLRFLRKSDVTDTYFTKAEVDGFLADMEAGNGLWDVTSATLDGICNDIAAKFDFTMAQAAL